MEIINKTLTGNFDSQKQYSVNYRAYCFDVELIENYKGRFNQIELITTYGKVYTISATKFFKYAELNTDYGKDQYFIKVKYLELKGRKATSITVNKQLHQKLKQTALQRNMRLTDLLETIVS